MRNLLVLSAVLAVTFSAKINDDLASVKFNDENIYDSTLESIAAPSSFNPQLINGNYETPLDHFSPTERRRLRLSYQSNVGFYEDNGPIFVHINDGTGAKWITSGLVYDVARELNGALVTADTRYTGRNVFFNATTENLRFLTIDHVLGDIAHLVTKVLQDYDAPNARVIIFGSRLAGTISALARKKFPHLIHGVFASGALFRAVLPERSYYNSLSWNIYHHGSEDCASNLTAAFQQVIKLVETRNSTRLTEALSLCRPLIFNNPQEVTNLYERLFRFVGNYVDARHLGGIQEICRDLVRPGQDPLRKFTRWLNYVYEINGDCRDLSYESSLTDLRNINSRSGQRALFYFFCTQFALNFFITSPNSPGEVFPNVINETYHANRCSELFGDTFNRTLLERAVQNFNIQHGSQNQVINNAIFSYGNLDPLLDHGMTEHDLLTSELVTTTLHSVGADMTSVSEYDSADLAQTKQEIIGALRRYAGRPTQEPGSSFGDFKN